MSQPVPFSSQIRSIDGLHSSAGRLEAVLNTGRDDARYAALVCHPHPPSGGTLHNKVVYNTMKVFSGLGLPVVRFNFRSAGLSEGAYDDGKGEQDDVRAALEWMEKNLNLPILFAGFSFGAYVGLRACCGDPGVKGLVGLGLPVRAHYRDYTYEFLPKCSQPKLFISGDSDEFSPRDAMQRALEVATEPKQLHWVTGADHFFQGTPASPGSKLPVMHGYLRQWLQDQFQLE
jgi:alpha/beta superfamily hydrolase